MPKESLKFWAYLHANGTVQVKRWWGDVKDYTDDIEENDFVIRILHPYIANDINHARELAWNHFNPNSKEP